MKFKEVIYLIKTDLYRQKEGRINTGIFLRSLLSHAEFKYTFWMRLTGYLREHKIYKYGPAHLANFILRHYQYKFGILIPSQTRIGSGFYISHFGGIVVSAHTVIGKNVSISPQVVIGRTTRGERQGNAVIGDNVYIGPGAKIIGKVKIGNNVAIGANCVVTKDVPDNAVVVGIPAEVISYHGAEGYIRCTDYDNYISRAKSLPAPPEKREPGTPA